MQCILCVAGTSANSSPQQSKSQSLQPVSLERSRQPSPGGDGSGQQDPQSHHGAVAMTTVTATNKPRGKGRPAKVGGSAARQGVYCPVCGKIFNNSSALAKHKLTHSDERKYVCMICSKAFKRQDHL